jgi:sugar (pentulose or hexulose) kinase
VGREQIARAVSELLMGIDIGTGSTKGLLARLDGEIVATAARSHQMSLPRPDWAEMDAEAIWWADVMAIGQELHRSAETVRAVRESKVSGRLSTGVSAATTRQRGRALLAINPPERAGL